MVVLQVIFLQVLQCFLFTCMYLFSGVSYGGVLGYDQVIEDSPLLAGKATQKLCD